jgi:hypothetical protein
VGRGSSYQSTKASSTARLLASTLGERESERAVTVVLLGVGPRGCFRSFDRDAPLRKHDVDGRLVSVCRRGVVS